ncbi:MAG: hypothetical protein U1F65_10180, partial [Verrucomicrobiota bacterium]
TPQGAGWDFSFNVSLTQNGDGTVTLHPGNGRADTFYPAGTNGWFRDEYFCQIIDLNGDSFPDVRFADTGKWIFNPLGSAAGGKLAQIIDRNGNTISLAYDSKGQLASIVDDLGRTNTVTINSLNQIVAVTDFSGRSASYEYDTDGNLISVISPPVTGTPTGNDFPGGITNRYTYTSGFLQEELNHNLSACVDGLGQTWLQITYQPATDPASLDFDRVDSVCTYSANGVVCSCSHLRAFPQTPAPSNNFAVLKIISHDGQGNVSESFCDSRGRMVRHLDYTGHCDPGAPVTENSNRPTGKLRADDPDYFQTQWTWNADSLCTTETLPDGEVTECVYQRAYNQNNARSNHAKAGLIDDSLHGGDLRVLRLHAAPGSGADLDGDGLNDLSELAWRFDYDPRFGSPAARGKKLYVGNLPCASPQNPFNRGKTKYRGWDGTVRGSFRTGGATVLDNDDRGDSVRLAERMGQRNTLGRYPLKQCFGGESSPGSEPGADCDTQTKLVPGSHRMGRPAINTALCSSFITSSTDPRGNMTTFGYDTNGNCVKSVKAGHYAVSNFHIEIDCNYNLHGQLTSITNAPDANGYRRVDRISYHSSGSQTGWPQSITIDEGGVHVTSSFEYDAVGNVTRCVDPRTNDWLFAYNALGQMVRAQTPTNILTRFKTDFIYDAAGNVQDAVEELWDASDTSKRNVCCHGDFNALNQLTALVRQVSAGVFITNKFSYDANGQLILVQTPMAVSGADPHATMSYEYDERGLLFREVGAAGSPVAGTNQFDYDANARIKRMQTELYLEPAFEAAALKLNPKRQKPWLPASFRVIYNGFGQPVTGVDGMSNVVTCVFDRNGNLTLTRFHGEVNDGPGGAGNVLLAQTSYQYDALDRLTASHDWHAAIGGAPIGDGYRTTRFDYAPNGDCVRVTDDNNHATSFAYDTAGRLSVISDPKTNLVSFAYDAAGNVVGITSTEKSDLTPGTPQVFSITRSFDKLHRLMRGKKSLANNDGLTNSFAYDSLSRCVATIDPNGNLTTTGFDDLSRETTFTVFSNSTLVVSSGSLLFNDNSRCVSSTDANLNTTTFAHDSLGRLTQRTGADGTHCSLVWSPRSNLLRVEDPNGTTVTNYYDACDRIIHRDLATRNLLVATTTTFETFAYDGLSRMVAATNDVSHDEFTYDTLGYCTTSRRDGWQFGHVHDAVGNQLSMTYPDGLVVSYTYNANDEVASVSTQSGAQPAVVQATYDYEGPGRVGRISRANNINTRIGWDGLVGTPNAAGDFGWRQVSAINHQASGGGTTIDRRGSKFDRNQNRVLRAQILPFVQNGFLTTNVWSHDALNRVKSGTLFRQNSIASKSFVLDGNGNRQLVVSNGVPQVYSMDNTPLPGAADFQMNQYTVTPFGDQTFDDNGNLLSRSPSAAQLFYQYDYADRLVSVAAVDSGTGTVSPVASYEYGPLGERISKTTFSASSANPPTVTRFVYGKEGKRVLQLRGQNGAMGITYVGTCDADSADGYVGPCDAIMLLTAAGTPLFIHGDDLGNTLALTASNGSVVERCDYDDFGQPTFYTSDGVAMSTNSSPVGNIFLFGGMTWDAETGFYQGDDTGGYDPLTARGINGINNSQMPNRLSMNRLSMNVTVPKQSQSAWVNPWSLKKEEGGRHTPFHNRHSLKSFFEKGDKPVQAQRAGHPPSRIIYLNRCRCGVPP